MSFTNHEAKPFATEKDILSLISDKDIFVHYLGGIPKRPISSPLRSEDKIPSFGLFMSNKYGKLFFKDFATGESGDCFVFVKRLFNLNKITDAYNLIVSDFSLNQFQTNNNQQVYKVNSHVSDHNKGTVREDKIRVQVKIRKWELKDKEYWHGKYHLSLKMLKHCNIYPISHYFLNDYCVKAEELAYVFVENKDNIQTFKIYQPFGVNKWVNNNDYSTWELWSQMPSTTENLIITSSRKDAMVIKSLFKPEFITSCALQAETISPKRIVMEELNCRANNKLILYDNDLSKKSNWGRIAGKKICDEFNDLAFKQVEIPDKFLIKDISDFIEVHGPELTRKIILEICLL